MSENLPNKNLIDLCREKMTNENIYAKDILPNGSFDLTVDFLQSIVDIMFVYLKESQDRSEKILYFYHPQELKEKLELDIKKEPIPLKQIVDDCEIAFKYAVKSAHPRFFNQLSQGLDIVSLAGEIITSAINSNMFTYEVSPLFNIVEEIVFEKMSNLIGWNEYDAIFSPGGSISNLYALLVAKHYYYPETKLKGLTKMPRLVVFTSDHSHYSIHRAACIIGLGADNVRNVPVDEKGKIRPDKLEEMIRSSLTDNELPFLVALTSGTTVLGAFDPINECADVCAKYNLWLHVDAAWGGGCLLSKKYRHLMNGIERADSVTWNPHKLMGASLQCSAFLIKRKGIMLDCNEMNASYLFQQDKHYDVAFDTGDKTIQCGRHVDAFKLWLMWRAKGDDGFENQINKLFELAEFLYAELTKRKNFEIVLENPEFTNVCFWYIPKSLEGMNRSSNEFQKRLNKIAPQIKEKMMKKGTLMVSYQPLDEKPNFFRSVFSNNATQKEDVLFMIDEIENLGKDL